MKTKLLKKIRKQYSIVYFKSGSEVYGRGKYFTDVYHVKCSKFGIDIFCNTKQECLDWILKKVRERYGKKLNYKGIKVWYNESV